MFYSVVFVKGEKDFSGDLPANPDTGAALGNDCCQVSAKKMQPRYTRYIETQVGLGDFHFS